MSAPRRSRDKILEAAELLFAKSGFAGVGLRQVADRVGLGKSSLFHHFPTKSHLYLEVLERVFQRIEMRIAVAIRSGGNAAERLDAFLDALFDALAKHPPTARLLLRALFEEDELGGEVLAQRTRADNVLARILSGFESLLRAGIASSEFRDVSVTGTIQTVIGAAVFQTAAGGASLSTSAIDLRKRELKTFVRLAIVAPVQRPNTLPLCDLERAQE